MIKKWDKNPNFVNEDFFQKVIALCILFKKSDLIVRTQEWYDSYKANIVAYTLSLIFYKVEKDFPERTIDMNQIWKKQDLSIGLENQIIKVSFLVYNHLIRDDRTVENVTEWAKREICWNMAKELEFEYDKNFVNDLIDKNYINAQERNAIKDQKKENEINALLKVYEYGTDFWKEVYNWGTQESIWSTEDISILNIAVKIEEGKIPKDRQAVKILELLEKAREYSFPK